MPHVEEIEEAEVDAWRSEVSTTMIYTHVLKAAADGMSSPLDCLLELECLHSAPSVQVVSAKSGSSC